MVHPNERTERNQTHLRPWPIRTKPFEDELLSSWLIRASFDNFTKPLILTSYLWGKWRAWTLDLDRELTKPRLHRLSIYSGVSEERIEQMMLRSTLEKISRAKLISQTPWPWVVARGTRNLNTYRYQPFCPECLNNDSEPYFRRMWRLSFITMCPKHQCLLEDCCPYCKQSVEPHRLKKKELRVCKYCQRDISSHPAKKANEELVNTTHELVRLINEPNRDTQDRFHQLDFWIAMLRKLSLGRTEAHREVFSDLVNRKDRALIASCSGVNFDFLTVETRATFLKYCKAMDSNSFSKEIAQLVPRGLSQSFMRSLLTVTPPPVLKILGVEHSSKPKEKKNNKPAVVFSKKPCSRPVVEKKWELLIRKHNLGNL
ncbi:TniQ family protein [Idiomarina piscisalsi]|uniref:TniQ domain-containing protein n=1 Tax=Idiomarina piscisalsi TaxID=1096243 RepID=A0A432YSD8_9GAMM|nr:hypothetical protein CWI73_07655 [Idiomarina piscisalsi]